MDSGIIATVIFAALLDNTSDLLQLCLVIVFVFLAAFGLIRLLDRLTSAVGSCRAAAQRPRIGTVAGDSSR